MAFRRIKTSSALFVQAWRTLKGDPTLVLFPVISTIATLLILASFALPIAMNPDLASEYYRAGEPAADGTEGPSRLQPASYAIAFAFYLVLSFSTIFFNCALLAAADRRFRGEPAGVAYGISAAMARLPQIIGWTLLSAVVGTILNMLERRLGIFGRIAVFLVGMAWAIATYFALPALVLEGVGPFTAVRRSVDAIRKTWGESLVLAIGIGLAGTLVTLVVGLTIVGGVVLIALGQPPAIGIAVIAVGVVLLIAWALVASTLTTIVRAALYRYAVDGSVPAGFDAAALQAAFARK